jgi:hypothetical protein
MLKAIKEFFMGKKVEEVQPAIITVTPTEVPYKVEAAAPVIETAPIVTIEAPVKKIRSSTPKTKSAKAAKTKK